MLLTLLLLLSLMLLLLFLDCLQILKWKKNLKKTKQIDTIHRILLQKKEKEKFLFSNKNFFLKNADKKLLTFLIDQSQSVCKPANKSQIKYEYFDPLFKIKNKTVNSFQYSLFIILIFFLSFSLSNSILHSTSCFFLTFSYFHQSQLLK